MTLSRRPTIYTLPSYSLTGDLLGFLRCGLQYRYTRVGQLPSARPVQLWFGQFIHGVLEEAFRRYHAARQNGMSIPFPWPDETIEEICELIKRRLSSQGLVPWDEALEKLGDARAWAAINELGPELFPIIHRAEVRLTGARLLPQNLIDPLYQFRNADRYEMVGIIDVITHVELGDPELQQNRLVQSIIQQLPMYPPEKFEVIIDYKGMRRPPYIPTEGLDAYSLWDIYGWQIQTYAHLRSTHLDSLPIVAGVIVYLNELLPTKSDLVSIRRESRQGITDVPAPAEMNLHDLLDRMRDEDDQLEIPLEFRLARAMRIVPVTMDSSQAALENFDHVVARIETCRGRELRSGRIISSWELNPADEDTCTRCDARTFCPDYEAENLPRLPGVRRR